jgi:hypothetical protein
MEGLRKIIKTCAMKSDNLALYHQDEKQECPNSTSMLSANEIKYNTSG